MQKGMNFLKGLGIGMVAGAAAAIAGKCLISENSGGIAKGSAKVVKAANEFVDGIQTMFK